VVAVEALLRVEMATLKEYIMVSEASLKKDRLRIILAITAKDLVEAIKNKNTLSVILPILFILTVYRFLPSFSHRDEPPTLFLFDPGESSFGLELQDNPFLNIYLSSSEERMKLGISESESPELGLALPADIDTILSENSSLALEGYAVHWLPDEQVIELEQAVEDELSAMAGKPVNIEIDATSIYPELESSGLSYLMGLSLTFSAVMIGVSFLPHLILEEKMTHTMEALQVTPVRPIDLTLGKALVGMTYAMIIGVIGIALYGPLITHWGVAVLVYAAGSLFMIALGLILGTLLENRQQLMLWAWVILIPLLIPTFLVIMKELVPDGAIAIMRWIPSVVLSRALTAATIEAVSLSDYLPELAVLLLGSLPVLGLVAWIIRRKDR
jgi:ABC-2 type transport system permease protein